MAIGVVDATTDGNPGFIVFNTKLDTTCLRATADPDLTLYERDADKGLDEMALYWQNHRLIELTGHQLRQPKAPEIELCFEDSSSLIHEISMISVDNSPMIQESPNMNGSIVITSSKGLLNELCHLENRREKETFHIHKSDTLYDFPGPNTLYSNHVHSKIKQRFDDVKTDKFNGFTQHQADGAQRVFKQLKNALFALIFQVSVSLHFARKYHHVAILAILLTEAACTDVYINCTGQGVSVASSDYPDMFIDIIAPEGRMILLNFDYVSLRSEALLIIADTIEPLKTKKYNREGGQNYPPFLSRRNKLQITAVLVESSGGGFNITASCYEISESNAGRLVDGISPAEGFLELSTDSESGGEWMRVCEENLTHRVAEIVCGELGYAIVKEVAYDNGECQSGSGGNCVRAPVCEEYSYRLQDCSPPSTNCTSSKAVKIKCFEPGFIGCYNHGITQLQSSSIQSSTPECVSSCRSDTVKALAIVNGSQQHVQCFCPTTDDIDLSDLTLEGACTHPVYNGKLK